jgi:hypothetical protein
MVYSGVLVEGEEVGELFPSLACVLCVLEAWFIVCKVFAIGHVIAMDSLHGVFLLAAAFALRRASIAILSCTDLLCVDVGFLLALLRALVSSFCSAVILFR